MQELEQFIEQWNSEEKGKAMFLRLKAFLSQYETVEISFHAREGLTYSLRGAHPAGTRPLFVMIDVIEDQPRWLSVCFYGDMLTDPQEKGDFVPGGLLGEDALCFDLDTAEEADLSYVEERIAEAWQAAAA